MRSSTPWMESRRFLRKRTIPIVPASAAQDGGAVRYG